jgi:hypothetical protein
MIVIGLDVHRSVGDRRRGRRAGRPPAEKVIPVGSDELLDWAAALDAERCGRWRTAGS